MQSVLRQGVTHLPVATCILTDTYATNCSDRLTVFIAAFVRLGSRNECVAFWCCRCLQDLEWASPQVLQHLLHILLLVTPFPSCQVPPASDSMADNASLTQLQAQQQLQPQSQLNGQLHQSTEIGGNAAANSMSSSMSSSLSSSGSEAELEQQRVEQLRALLVLLQPLVRSSSKRLTTSEVNALVKVFFTQHCLMSGEEAYASKLQKTIQDWWPMCSSC